MRTKIWWIIWSIIWIIYNQNWMENGEIARKSMFFLILQCIISIIAAEIMLNSKILTITTIIILIIWLVTNMNDVTIVCFLLDILLYVFTKILTPKKSRRRS